MFKIGFSRLVGAGVGASVIAAVSYRLMEEGAPSLRAQPPAVSFPLAPFSTITELQHSQMTASQQALLGIVPIVSKPADQVRPIVKATINSKKVSVLIFDKIQLWEEFMAYAKANPNSNTEAQFLEFPMNESAIFEPPKYGSTRGRICSDHAIWGQNELKRQGVVSYVVAKHEKKVGEDLKTSGYTHAELAIKCADEKVLMIDIFEHPEILREYIDDKSSNKDSLKIEAAMNTKYYFDENGRLCFTEKKKDIEKKKDEVYECYYTTNEVVESISNTVSKSSMRDRPKMPWVARVYCPDKDKLIKKACVNVNLGKANIELKIIEKLQTTTVNLEDIHNILSGKNIKPEHVVFSGKDFPTFFGLEKIPFWTRLINVLSPESLFLFKKFPCKNSK